MAKSAKAIGKARARLGKAKAKAKPKMGKAKGKAKPTAWDEHVDRAQAMGAAGPDDGKGDGVTKKPAAAGASVLNRTSCSRCFCAEHLRDNMGRLGSSRRGGRC